MSIKKSSHVHDSNTKGHVTVATAATELGAIERALDLADPLTRAARHELAARVRSASDALVASVAQLAEEGGGSVAGIAFDAASAKATLAEASDAKVGAAAGRRLAQRLADHGLAGKAAVCERALAIVAALAAHVRTPEGKPLRPKYEELRALARKAARRSKRKPKTPEPTAAQPAAEEPPAPPAGAPQA